MILRYFGSMVPAYHGESKAASRFRAEPELLEAGYALRRGAI